MLRILEIQSDTNNIKKLRDFLYNIFVEFDIDKSLFNSVFLSVSEAVINSIIHGNQCDINKIVSIVVQYEKSDFLVTVKDQGSGFDFMNVTDPTIECNIRKESGRGIFLLRSMSDEVIFEELGSCVKIKFRISR